MNLDLSKVSPGCRQDVLRGIVYAALDAAKRAETELENWEWIAQPGWKREDRVAWFEAARALAKKAEKEIQK